MRKTLSVLAILLGVLIVVGLSIWVGFPTPVGFDRTAICLVGYMLGIGTIIIGFVGITWPDF